VLAKLSIEMVKLQYKVKIFSEFPRDPNSSICLFKLSRDSRFQRAFTACSCVFKVITLIGSNQGIYFENATVCSKRTLKMTVAMQLYYYCSFENSICDDYVTEKFFKVLGYNIVPIVLGGANYYKIAPNKSYINVRDFESPARSKFHQYLIKFEKV